MVGTGGGAGGCSIGGESPEHEELKRAIITHLDSDYPQDGTVYSEKQAGDCIADVLFEFTTPQDGKAGLVVQAQYRNNSKDYLGVTKNALRSGYSIHWVFHPDARDSLFRAKHELECFMSKSPYLAVVDQEVVTLGMELYYDNFDYYVDSMAEFSPPRVNYDWHACWVGRFDLGHKEVSVYTFNDQNDEIHYLDTSGGGVLQAHYDLEARIEVHDIRRLSPVNQPEKIHQPPDINVEPFASEL